MLQPANILRLGSDVAEGAGAGVLELESVDDVARPPLSVAAAEPGVVIFAEARNVVSGAWFDLNCCCNFADRYL